MTITYKLFKTMLTFIYQNLNFIIILNRLQTIAYVIEPCLLNYIFIILGVKMKILILLLF